MRDGDIYYLLLACDNCDSAETAGEIVFYTKVSLALKQEFNPLNIPLFASNWLLIPDKLE